jgi:putative tryptophan/tyrosine transport system substrate-binding protein
MKRRGFLGLVAGAVAWPYVTRAQQGGSMRRLGVLAGYGKNDSLAQTLVTTLVEGLAASGWRDGHNLQIDWRWASGDAKVYESCAAELLALRPDVLLAQSSPSVRALRRSTNAIPTVFIMVTDPLGQGFVASLAHPGGNVTGFSDYDPPIAGKWVELLKQIKPSITRIALLYNPGSTPFADLIIEAVDPAARSFTVTARSLACRDDAQINAVMRLIGSEHGGALVMPEIFTTVHRDAIVAAAARYRVPAIYPDETSITRGELMSYGIDPADVFRRSASYVDRILKGERPADLPVQNPTKFRLTINLKTAKAIGLVVPPKLLALADAVTE